MNVDRLATLVIVLAAAAFGGCGPESTPQQQPVTVLPTIDVVLAGRQFKLEVADDDHEREIGMMRRTSMPVDRGMIFVFPDVQPRNFWMKNTVLPLDIAYIDESGVVLNVAKMYPNDLTTVPSSGPAKFAIELNQGVSERIGLKAGDKVVLPPLKGE